MIGGRNIGVTLFVAGEVTDDVRHLLDESAAQLADAGIDIKTETATGSPFDALIDAVPGHDAIVIGEKAPSLMSLLFGEESDRIASASVGPVLVVRDVGELNGR